MSHAFSLARTSMLWLAVFLFLPQASAEARDPLDSLVEVRVIYRSSDLLYPWRRNPALESFGSGAIIKGHRILTAAHVIEDQVSIEVRPHGSSKWTPARVEHVSHQADLALLSVPEERFWKRLEPLRLGKMPRVRDSVQVLGFPIGGDSAAVTRGIVSRIHVTTYSYSRSDLLIAQIDAPINSGASGGPVIANGKLVGVVLQAVDPSRGESIGEIAPLPVIEHFLRDVGDGHVDGFPRSGIWWQQFQAPAHRASLGVPDDGIGVLVSHVDEGSPAFGLIEPGDILRSIDEFSVADDGTIEVPTVGRTSLEFAVQMKDAGSPIMAGVLRHGEPRSVRLAAASYSPVIPQRHFSETSPYLIFAGVVFQPLTYRYFSVFEDNDPPPNLGAASMAPFRTRDRHQVIVISGLLPSASTSSYRWAEDRIVRRVDGKPVRDLAHLAALLDAPTQRFVRIEVDGSGELVFDREQARIETIELLSEHDAPRDRDLGPTELQLPADLDPAQGR